MTKIDWIKEFENLDPSEKQEVKAYKVTTENDKRNYVSKGAVVRTKEYMKKFKWEVRLLSLESQLNHTESLLEEKLRLASSQGDQQTLNSLVYEAQVNFYKFLDLYKAHLIEQIGSDKNKKQIQNKTNEQKLSLYQVALIHVYEGRLIDKDNCNAIAESYGWKSGEKLKKLYNNNLRRSQRVGSPGSDRPLKEKIKRLSSIVPIVSEGKRSDVIKDLEHLEGLLNKE